MKTLVVIDVQKNLVERKLYQKEEFLETIRGAVGAFRKAGLPVVFVQHNNNFLVSGQEGWRLDDSIGAKKTDAVVQKKTSNCFEKTGLPELLKKKDVDEVLICGLVTHGCVRASCLGGLSEGFSVSLLRNGHTSWAKDAAERIERVEAELAEAGVRISDAG